VAQCEAIQHPAAPQAPAHAAQGAAPSTADVTHHDRRAEPWTVRIGGQDFAVVLHLKRLTRAHADRPQEAAVSALEIQDSSGATLYRETFSYALEDGNLLRFLPGLRPASEGRVHYGIADRRRVFAFRAEQRRRVGTVRVMNGTLQRFGKPFTTDGDFLNVIPVPRGRMGGATLFLPDVMLFRVRTGKFQVTVPVRVDLMQGRLDAGTALLRANGARVAGERL